MKEDVKFSVLVPVYNAEKYLDICIDSIVFQTYKNFELILVNDGSTDHSAEICDRYAVQYPFIHVFHKANKGQLHTREYAISKASGEWMIFVDADDILEKNAMEIIYRKIKEYGPDVVIYGQKRFSPKGVFFSSAQGNGDRCLEDRREFVKAVLYSNCYHGLCCKAVKADCLGNKDYSAFYHLRRSEDLLQTIEVLENAKKVLFIEDLLYNYRYNPDSVSNTVNYRIFLDEIDVLAEILLTFRQHAFFNEGDYIEYRSFCLKKLTGKIIAAACDTKLLKKKKNELFDSVKQHPLFDSFLTQGAYNKHALGKKYIIYLLFLQDCYWGIHLVAGLFHIKQGIKRLLRHKV